MNFRTPEQILAEQPSIERKIQYRGNKFKLINTVHDISRGEYVDLTCYTYHNEEVNQTLLLYCYKGKVVLVETE